jgi:hypothetical protein
VLIVGATLSLALLVLLWVRTTASLTQTLLTVPLPVGLAGAYVWFRQAHPPGYDLDLLVHWLTGPAFGPTLTPPPAPEAAPGATLANGLALGRGDGAWPSTGPVHRPPLDAPPWPAPELGRWPMAHPDTDAASGRGVRPLALD